MVVGPFGRVLFLTLSYLAHLPCSGVHAQEESKRVITAGTLVCVDPESAADVSAILDDLDREVLVRRLMLVLSTGGCTDRFQGVRYESVATDNPRYAKIRLNG